MATALPAAADTFTEVPAGTKQGVAIGGRTHRQFINDHGDSIEALISMIGVGASNATPTAGKVRRATGTGTAEWGAVQTGDIATGGQIVKRQLNYLAATDIANGVSIGTGGTWTDLGTNQTFTVDDANSTVEIAVRGYVQVGSMGSGGNVGVRIVLDSAGTPQNIPIGGAFQPASSSVNGFGGIGLATVTGLSAGSHTVKVQLTASASGGVMYVRPATNAFEALGITVIEDKR